jgi:hypothetical protein
MPIRHFATNARHFAAEKWIFGVVISFYHRET